MKIQVSKLLEGLKNSIWVKEQVEAVAAKRIAECRGCEYYSPNRKAKGEVFNRSDAFCVCCGCNMYLKTRSLAARCPLGDPEYPLWQGFQPRWLEETDGDTAALVEGTSEVKKDMDEYKTKLMQNKVTE